ncbi:hypothetical protein ABZW11_17390 [Nonomuraea sp. NPDC004580]|uniref:hypothetical protein n=1 Tax=Nonomuraea sp. NPDC004580 TaxID=3154552 RepID=UPI0033B6364D
MTQDETTPPTPLALLDEATARYWKTKQAHERAQQDVIAAALDALKARERPTDVAERSPFTDAYIRRLARDNGIKAQPKSKGPRRRAAAPPPETSHPEAS